MPSTMISDGVLLLYQQRRKSKFIKNKIPEGASLLFHSVISPLALPSFSGEGLRVVGVLNMIGWLMVKFKALPKKSRSKVSDQRSMIY